ncbi:MAG: glycosyltransferase [Candidatus Dojkabacteria bacterium]|nr:MAG: glycosyltransferase [Candidatus Dojkabacteria bacterium]
MKVLFITPEIEDTKYRGVQFVIKQYIKALHTAGNSIAVTTSYPQLSVKVSSSELKKKVSRTYVNKYFADAKTLLSEMYTYPGRLSIFIDFFSGLFASPQVTHIEKNSTAGIATLQYIDETVNIPGFYKFVNVMPRFLRGYFVSKLAQKVDADVVVVSYPIALPKMKHVKVAQIIYDLIPFEISEESAGNKWLLKLAQRLDTATKNSNMILTISEDSKKKILEIKEDAHVVNVGAAVSAYEEELASFKGLDSALTKFNLEKGSYLLFMSSVERRKNVHRLIQAYVSVADKLGKKLVILGNDKTAHAKAIKDEARSAPRRIRNNIIFTGYASEEDKYSLLQNAAALINPTLYEGFSLPVLEAFVFDCPVATSLVGATKEVAGDAVVPIANPYSISAIADAMVKVITDESLQKELIIKGRKQSALFTESVLQQKLQRAFSEIE